ncbi:MAG: hypothetical protein K2W88_17935 [Pararheinheimera sp.]|nr:hypothetical protein [Rheinheimera sp.]
MQEFIDFIFLEVWCKAPIGLPFHAQLFDDNPVLKGVIVEFGFSAQAPERGKVFYKDVKAIYGLFASLTPPDIYQFKQWYRANNDIENVCANDPTIQLLRYKDIFATHAALGKQLAVFFRSLYDSSFLGLSAIKGIIGNIKDHNKKFFETNKVGKCPFCGINDLKGIHHTRREAYDHYLPKYRYPFNSINFRNLAPACYECNSTYKLTKDPAHNPTGRRKAFYPYAAAEHSIDIQIALKHANIEKLKPSDVQMQFGPAAITEEIETWKDVYGIEERYKAKLCSPDANDWIEEFRLLNRRRLIPAKEYLEDLEGLDSFSNCNFLRRAFLRAFNEIGILETFEQYKDDNAEYENGKEGKGK